MLFYWLWFSTGAAFAFDADFKTRMPRMVITSALLGVALLASLRQMEPLMTGVLPERIFGLAGLVIGGLILYGILAGDAHSYIG